MRRRSRSRSAQNGRTSVAAPASSSRCFPSSRRAVPAEDRRPRRHAGAVAAAVAPAGASRRPAGSGRRSRPHADRRLGPPFQGRPDGARAGPRRGGQAGIQPRRRRAARVALRRPDRAADPRALRPAGRPHQHLRSAGAGRRATASPRRNTSRRRSTSCWRCRRRSARRRADAGTERRRPVGPRRPASHDIPIPLNQRVLAYIELFQGRLHDFIEEGMKRGSKYLPMIQNVFRAEGLPLDLAYVPLVESAFKPNALSRAKAKGVWQFMTRHRRSRTACGATGTSTSARIRKRRRVAAAKYLRTLSKMFDGDWHLALASYNGGPGRLQRAMKSGRRRRLLEAGREAEGSAARDPRIRADDPRGHRHRPEPGAVRLRLRDRSRRRRTRRSRCRARSTCGASPSGPTRRSTRFRRSTPSCAAGRRRSGTRSTS